MTGLPDVELDDPDIDLGLDGDGDRAQCEWGEELCGEEPTHFVVSGPTDAPHTALYCARHYGLTLAFLLEVHLATCEEPVAAHARRFGALA